VQQQHEEMEGNLIFTGASRNNRGDNERAVEQIQRTFASIKRLKVGATKPGDPSVTAVSVTEVVPSHFAALVP